MKKSGWLELIALVFITTVFPIVYALISWFSGTHFPLKVVYLAYSFGTGMCGIAVTILYLNDNLADHFAQKRGRR